MPKTSQTTLEFPGLELADRPLGQLRIAAAINEGTGANAEVLYQLPNDRTTAIVRTITVANTEPSQLGILIYIYMHITGTPVYTADTAVWWRVELLDGEFLHLDDLEWGISDQATRVAVACDTIDGATFTLFGREIVRT
jgi:hypothetical protein